MKVKITCILLVIAALLLGAHFLRHGNLFLVALSALAPLLLLVRHRWSLYVLQALAYAGAGVWIYTAFRLVELRSQYDRPWGVAAVILGTVSLVTLLAGLLLNSRGMKDRYRG